MENFQNFSPKIEATRTCPKSILSPEGCEPPFHYLGVIDLFFAIFVKLSIEKPTKSPKKSVKPK